MVITMYAGIVAILIATLLTSHLILIRRYYRRKVMRALSVASLLKRVSNRSM